MTPTNLTDLDQLLAWLRSPAAASLTDHDWTNLPTYGGAEPHDTLGVWSWDATRLLVGDSRRELAIVPRPEGRA